MQVTVGFYASGEMIIRLGVVQTVVSGCCDFMAQCIMVRINHSKYLSEILNHPFIHLDIPLLNFVGSKYPFRYHSFIPGNRIHRSVTARISN